MRKIYSLILVALFTAFTGIAQNVSSYTFSQTTSTYSEITGGTLFGSSSSDDERFVDRAEIIWEKGTNRSAFFKGEVDKYGWVDVGSSFLPSEVIAAFLWAQLESIQDIQKRRCTIWNTYYKELKLWAEKHEIGMPLVHDFASNNAHMFYLVCKDLDQRTQLIAFLKGNNILAVFHYISLHTSPFYEAKHDGRNLPETDRYTDCLVRLPMYYDLEQEQQELIIKVLLNEK